MISQADIIRSLVGKNCTDEGIMSTALSPDCTLPKLLQKFTEAERFDLALDVYMKLGMDVVPLWKTWAMRCLKNRDFQGARDKFRHCFQRLRSSAGRFGAATKGLLQDILKELKRMRETKPPLSEEVDLIVNSKKRDRSYSQQDLDIDSLPTKIDKDKPKIFSECMHYLKEYGTTELLIKFYVDNELWSDAIATLFETRGSRDEVDSFFISSVISPSEVRGQLDQVVAELLKLDPAMSTTSGYFRALYNHLAKRYNSLYYLQHEIGDYVGAAENQIDNFFLKKPTQNYKELNQRLAHLISAREEYQEHLKRLECDNDELRVIKDSGADDADDESSKKSLSGQGNSLVLSRLSRDATKARLETIEGQMEITRNFAINEVPGCIGDIEVVCETARVLLRAEADHDSPVTLFDACPRRRTFLTALVLVYFDPDCSSNISSEGFRLANKLISESDLDKLSVFKTAMNIIIEDESSDIIENANLLLRRLRDDYIACTQRAKLKASSSSARRGSSAVATATIGSITSTTGTSSNSNSSSISISKNVISRPRESEKNSVARTRATSTAPVGGGSPSAPRTRKKAYNFEPPDKSIRPGSDEAARLLCDEVIRDSIKSCREEDYKMELIKLLSPEAKVVLYIELGKLSVAQRLAFDLSRPDYVKMVLREAEKLNQDHVKDVCQHWLAKN